MCWIADPNSARCIDRGARSTSRRRDLERQCWLSTYPYRERRHQTLTCTWSVEKAPCRVVSKGIETSVIAHAVIGVTLDVVTAEVSQTRPGVDVARPDRYHSSDGFTTLVCISCKGLFERVASGRLGPWQFGGGQTLGVQLNRTFIAHAPRLRCAPEGACRAQVCRPT